MMENKGQVYKEKVKLKTSKLAEVDCPNCGVPVHPDNININKSMGKCDSCHELFTFEKDDFFFDDRPGRPEMIMPEGTDVLTLSDYLDIRVNWFKSYSRSGLLAISFFTFFWNAVVSIFVINVLMSGSLIGLLAISAHLIIGLGMMYWLASIFFNKTDIIVNTDEIRIEHTPLKNPFKPNKIIPHIDFEQLYVTKYLESTTNGKPNYAYALHAIKKNGGNELIIKGMNKETQLYLEQEIERYLHIKDDQIKGAINQ